MHEAAGGTLGSRLRSGSISCTGMQSAGLQSTVGGVDRAANIVAILALAVGRRWGLATIRTSLDQAEAGLALHWGCWRRTLSSSATVQRTLVVGSAPHVSSPSWIVQVLPGHVRFKVGAVPAPPEQAYSESSRSLH